MPLRSNVSCGVQMETYHVQEALSNICYLNTTNGNVKDLY